MASKSFRPAWWLPGGHLQTLWPFFFSRGEAQSFERERLDLADGDFIDLDWDAQAPLDGPLVLVLHGLEGSSDSMYVRRLLPQLRTHGLRAVIMHFRGCSGESNRLPRAYHAGDSGDLNEIVTRLHARNRAQRPVCAIGYSLGGNVLLKWLGETGSENPLQAAAAISVPFDLHAAADRLERGFSRLYQSYLLRPLRAGQRRKQRERGIAPPLTADELDRIRTLRVFDDRVTAPLHGFSGVDEYYTRSSSRPWLAHIVTPTLLVHARNDPFLGPDGIPSPDELSPSILFELSDDGGHVGFVSGSSPWKTEPWLEKRIAEWLSAATRV